MSNGMSRLVVWILMLALGFTGGYLAGRAGGRPTGGHAVTVGPLAAQVDPETVTLSKKEEELLFWASRKKGRYVRIEFEEEVFENMTKLPNGRFGVDCRKRQCFSDEIRLPADPVKPYKYWQVLTDPDGKNPDEKDGHVIIDK